MAGRQRTLTVRRDWRYSISTMWEHMKKDDTLDMLAKEMQALSELKDIISAESRKNFALGKEILTLDQKIALLVKNRISLEEAEAATGDFKSMGRKTTFEDERQRKHYENLFFLLQSEPRHLAMLAHEVRLAEIDSLLRTVMFTLYGNQYDAHDEHMLLILFEMVLAKVYEESSEMGSLMRSNTAITRMMTTYTRRGPGQDYLKNTLAEPLSAVCDGNVNLEVNPLKVYDQMINDYETETGEKSALPRSVTSEDAAANADVKRLIAERIPQLMDNSERFLAAVINSCNEIPYGIRWICKQISILTKHKFPEATRTQRSSLIGGFFLLRFVNPSIVTPHSFMLIATKPSPIARRSLTYVAKLIQNLSNGTRFGEKEPHMSPFNAFVDGNKERMGEFLDQLCNVEDPRDFLEMDEYLQMTRHSVPTINISLNEVYMIHSLINTHLEKMTGGNAEDALAIIMKDLGESPAQVPRAVNGTVELHLINRFDSEEGAGAVSASELKVVASQLYSETRALLFNLYRAETSLPGTESPSLPDALTVVIAKRSRESAESGAREIVELSRIVMGNLRILNDSGLVTAADNYERLRNDVRQDLANVDSKIEKIKKQRGEFEHIVASIREHNSFLLLQLESFEAYLDNVREKAYKSKSGGGSSKSGKGRKSKKAKAHKFGHVDLEKKGIITDSEVPEERRQFVQFSFTSSRPGFFEIRVKYKGQGRNKDLFEMELKLDDLLEQQHRGELEYDLDYVTLDVNLLVHLLTKTFIN